MDMSGNNCIPWMFPFPAMNETEPTDLPLRIARLEQEIRLLRAAHVDYARQIDHLRETNSRLSLENEKLCRLIESQAGSFSSSTARDASNGPHPIELLDSSPSVAPEDAFMGAMPETSKSLLGNCPSTTASDGLTALAFEGFPMFQSCDTVCLLPEPSFADLLDQCMEWSTEAPLDAEKQINGLDKAAMEMIPDMLNIEDSRHSDARCRTEGFAAAIPDVEWSASEGILCSDCCLAEEDVQSLCPSTAAHFPAEETSQSIPDQNEMFNRHPAPPPPLYGAQQLFRPPDLQFGFSASGPKGILDKYILTLMVVLRRATKLTGITFDGLESLSMRGISWILQEAWPAAEEHWKFATSLRGFLQAETWRIFPCQKTYEKLHPAYRPTMLQLTIPHSPVIDWLPWPDLRDRIIAFQDQIDVDAVCRSAIQHSMSHRRLLHRPLHEELESDVPSFRIWDLHLLEKQSGMTISDGDLSYRPRSPGMVALTKAYDLVHDDIGTQRLHSDFFDQYPLLNCQNAKSKFRAQPIPLVVPQELGWPKQIDYSSVARLKCAVRDVFAHSSTISVSI